MNIHECQMAQCNWSTLSTTVAVFWQNCWKNRCCVLCLWVWNCKLSTHTVCATSTYFLQCRVFILFCDFCVLNLLWVSPCDPRCLLRFIFDENVDRIRRFGGKHEMWWKTFQFSYRCHAAKLTYSVDCLIYMWHKTLYFVCKLLWSH